MENEKLNEIEKPFIEELIEKGMLLELTENSQDIIIEHTHQLSILNKRLNKLITLLSAPEVSEKLKNKAYNKIFNWVALNLLRP